MSRKYVINDQLDNITLAILGLQGEDSTGLYFKSFRALQAICRMGLASKIIDTYSQIHVNRETALSVATTGSITATVDAQAFVTAIGTAETMDYEFIYDGSAWKFGGLTVAIATYGITVTGTPAENDTIVVHETAKDVTYDVIGIDYDIPVDANLSHSITLCSHDVENYNVLAYCKPQALIYVDPTTYPNGLTAGTTYYVTLDHGAYDLSTSEDGSYSFTPTQNVPAGGAVRHTTMGVSVTTGYSQARVAAGTFTTYDTIANGRAVIESGLATTIGATGTSLGTVTGEDISLLSDITTCNLTRYCAYGSNNYATSDERQWMNSRAIAGVKSNGDMNWHKLIDNFALPATYNGNGFLYSLDPSLVEVLGTVRKRTYVKPKYRSDQTVKYIDTEELVFPLSMTEINKGASNDGVVENPVDASGNVISGAYPYFARRSTNDEFIKYQNGTTARYWWLRSPHPSHATVRSVNTSGTLSNNHAAGANGAVCAFCIC